MNYQMGTYPGFTTPSSTTGIMTPSSMIRTPSSMTSSQNRTPYQPKVTTPSTTPYTNSTYNAVRPSYASAALGATATTSATGNWSNQFVKSGTLDSSSLASKHFLLPIEILETPAYTSVKPAESSESRFSKLTLPQSAPQKKFPDSSDISELPSSKKAASGGSQVGFCIPTFF
jgi:hypothetical protein